MKIKFLFSHSEPSTFIMLPCFPACYLVNGIIWIFTKSPNSSFSCSHTPLPHTHLAPIAPQRIPSPLIKTPSGENPSLCELLQQKKKQKKKISSLQFLHRMQRGLIGERADSIRGWERAFRMGNCGTREESAVVASHAQGFQLHQHSLLCCYFRILSAGLK